MILFACQQQSTQPPRSRDNEMGAGVTSCGYGTKKCQRPDLAPLPLHWVGCRFDRETSDVYVLKGTFLQVLAVER
jgi:hypothetical protein